MSSSRKGAALARTLLALAAVAATGASPANAPIKPWAGGPTPALALESLDGRRIDLAAMRGKVVMLNFWATWCEPCRDEMPSLQRLHAKMKGRPFEVLAVNYGESNERVKAFAAKLGISLPVLLDPYKRSSGDWKVRGLPMTFVVDAQGKVRYWTFGERDWSEKDTVKLLEDLLAEAKHAGS